MSPAVAEMECIYYARREHPFIEDIPLIEFKYFILRGTVKGGRGQGGQKKRWEDNIREWTGLVFSESQRAVENKENGGHWL